MTDATNPTVGGETVQGLWARRHSLTAAEWQEAAPVLLGMVVALQSAAADLLWQYCNHPDEVSRNKPAWEALLAALPAEARAAITKVTGADQ